MSLILLINSHTVLSSALSKWYWKRWCILGVAWVGEEDNLKSKLILLDYFDHRVVKFFQCTALTPLYQFICISKSDHHLNLRLSVFIFWKIVFIYLIIKNKWCAHMWMHNILYLINGLKSLLIKIFFFLLKYLKYLASCDASEGSKLQ